MPLIALRALPSLLPREIEMVADATSINWRLRGASWQELLPLASISSTVTVGTVTTLPSGSAAYVTPSGTAKDPILNFGIPVGASGVTSITPGAGILVNTANPLTPVVSVDSGSIGFALLAAPDGIAALTAMGYQTGTFTPIIQFGGASTGITYGTPTRGRYTKIGRLVLATGDVTLTSKGTATGPAQIGGLPFSSISDGMYAPVTFGYTSGLASVTGAVQAMVNAGTPRINLYQAVNGTTAGLSNANLSNTATFTFSVLYEVD